MKFAPASKKKAKLRSASCPALASAQDLGRHLAIAQHLVENEMPCRGDRHERVVGVMPHANKFKFDVLESGRSTARFRLHRGARTRCVGVMTS